MELQDSDKDREDLLKKRETITQQYCELKGHLQALSTSLSKVKADLQKALYADLDKKLVDISLQYKLSTEIVDQMSRKHDALEKGLMEYHHYKMKEINKQLEDFWKMTYKGSDI